MQNQKNYNSPRNDSAYPINKELRNDVFRPKFHTPS